MISKLATNHKKEIGLFLLTLFYCNFLLATYQQCVFYENKERFVYGGIGDNKENVEAIREDVYMHTPSETTIHDAVVDDDNGPAQPEMQAFQSVSASNMVDLFSGDFSYNIPLMDVGGYPVNIAYRSGVSMDQEASWVGLGWNINPGTITRNMRGLPDDFSGRADTVTRTVSIKENKTVGVTAGADLEVLGLPVGVRGNLGVFYNTYKGWGMETGLNASINAGKNAKGPLSAGLSISSNTQDGLNIEPSASLQFRLDKNGEKSMLGGNVSMGFPYSSRTGLKGLQLSAGVRQWSVDDKNQQYNSSSSFSSVISFAMPSYTPTMSYPMTSTQFTFTVKPGTTLFVNHPSLFLSGYVTNQKIDDEDKVSSLPAFGYLNYQQSGGNASILLDYNREKDMPYREKPAIPNIAIPSYTYDVFSITGEGTGGMFRAYRGDIGYVHDNALTTKDKSDRASIDLGVGGLIHGGVDLNVNRAFTQTGPWINQNTMRNSVAFKKSNNLFEATYFRNPGEKSISSVDFYNRVGGDDVVTVDLSQGGSSDPVIVANNFLNRYKNGVQTGALMLSPLSSQKLLRDKRAQVISYLTSEEAENVGLSKYIENYALNKYEMQNCNEGIDDMDYGDGEGLIGQYYEGKNFNKFLFSRTDTCINYSNSIVSHQLGRLQAWPVATLTNKEDFSVRWIGRIKAPVTGRYYFNTVSDDGIRLFINDSLIIRDAFIQQKATDYQSFGVNLIAGEMYDIKLEYYQGPLKSVVMFGWTLPGQTATVIPKKYLYHPPEKDTLQVSPTLTLEKRVTSMRKSNHISEIDVLNTDGRRYVYGIPVYNIKQKEVSFSVDASGGNAKDGLVKYTAGLDNTTGNDKGKDNYFNSEEMPSYAHSFLLTGILSPDYVDLKGDGITPDDPGDAVKFNYSKVSGATNPYEWRAPYISDSATYNEGFKTYSRDDKGNYVYGQKELWYLNSIVSKTMIATFKVSDRHDLLAINENGQKQYGSAKKLDEINLYTKADFLKYGENATPVKTVHFEYSYELCRGINKPVSDSGKLTLKKVWFTYNGNNKGVLNPYVFNYNKINPRYNIKSYDRWGNYKDPLQNPGSTIANTITNTEFPYALQDSAVAADNAAAWTLDSIGLPSGGKIKVTYESDDYAYVQNKRAMQMFKIEGFSLFKPATVNDAKSVLYANQGLTMQDYLYIVARVPSTSTMTQKEVYNKYLQGVEKLYFRTAVQMPTDQWGRGYETVPCYAGLDLGAGYGQLDATHIWFKMKPIDNNGYEDKGNISPLAKAAIQFLRLNLPSKAYPNSEVMDNFGLIDAVKSLFSMAGDIKDALTGFDNKARSNGWAKQIDKERSFVRLNSPEYKKIGGGLRVKRITIYDNWNKMTGKKEATYGQEYDYTTEKEIDGKTVKISSGVAAYEPTLGGEENPFHLPIEYAERIAPLAPVSLGYSEEPLGESFFPSASVGYQKVRVRSIHNTGVRSATGYEESTFYTAYDFPTYTEQTVLNDNKKRFSPTLANLLRINSRHYLAVSQGFKVELNDMHGKLRSQSTYNASNDVISQTFNYYKLENDNAQQRRLSNKIWAISPSGNIDTAALIGKDIELMMDMRQERSVSEGINFNANVDLFVAGFWPVAIPTFLGLFQHEETIFKSVATTKIVQRYGILDSVLHVEKGSKVSTKSMLYDSETGEVILTRTQNEFNDPIYNFSFPSHWMYEGMSGAYQNIDALVSNVNIKAGKIVSGIAVADSVYFFSGDEVLIASKFKTDPEHTGGCVDSIATFPNYLKAWVVNSNELKGGAKNLFFIDKDGKSVTANDATIKVVRSGRRNINTAIGQITSLKSPLIWNGSSYVVQFDNNTGVINASSVEFKQDWRVDDKIKSKQECIIQ